jgi:hypothetical protein
MRSWRCRSRVLTAAAGLVLAVTWAGAPGQVMVSAFAQLNDAAAPNVSVEGPWAYAQRFNKAANAPEYMAATPAKEDANTWLLLVCGAEGRVTAAFVNLARFPFSTLEVSSVLLRVNALPAIPVALTTVRPNQLTIAPKLAHHLLPLFADSDQVVASISHGAGMMHDYTFSLQPNDAALGAIARHCVP